MDIQLRALELACSKLCHDVISPIGAVNNGLELLEEEEDAALKEEATALAQRSARRASILLQVYRSAFGNAGNQQTFGPREAVALAQEFLRDRQGAAERRPTCRSHPPSRRATASWPSTSSSSRPTPCRAAARSSSRSVRRSWAQGAIEVDCAGQQIAWSEEFARAIGGKLQAEELTAHNILPYVASAFAQRIGMTLSVSQQGPGILGIRAASR